MSMADEARRRGIGRPRRRRRFAGSSRRCWRTSRTCSRSRSCGAPASTVTRAGRAPCTRSSRRCGRSRRGRWCASRGLPGEFSQHDFGHVDVRFMDGSTKRIHFFASRLKYSRWVEVTIVENERVETLLARSSITSPRSAAFPCWPCSTARRPWRCTGRRTARSPSGIRSSPRWRSISAWAWRCAGHGAATRREPSRTSSAG